MTTRIHGGLLIAAGLLTGCATTRPPAGPAPRGLRAEEVAAASAYAIGCPDVLDVEVAGRPAWGGRSNVGPDGCVILDGVGRVRVDGLTPDGAAGEMARAAGLDPGRVRVRVLEYRSRPVYVFGPVAGMQRAVAYQGPETVSEFLRRVGGLEPGAAVDSVHVVRPHVADGRPPEVFDVDLPGVGADSDSRTNIRLEPFDQVYVGETKRSIWVRLLPPWLRPVWEALLGLNPLRASTNAQE